jgi:hypothetical protein
MVEPSAVARINPAHVDFKLLKVTAPERVIWNERLVRRP